MDIKLLGDAAVVCSEAPIITDAQSALDLIAEAGFVHHVRKIVLDQTAVSEDFFRLSTGLAGEVVQKFVNYHCQLAIVGDFSHYTSQPLQDYIRECNKGRHVFFVSSCEEALERFGRVLD